MSALVVLLCAGIFAQEHAQTLAERAFEKLRQQPPPHSDSFEFVLIGDTRSAEPVVLPEVFRQSIREWNILRPAFVIDAGDLVLGGSAEGLDPQWQEFENTVAECGPPFIPVVGNHDVSDPATEKIYVDRVGPLTFAFSYGNSRFIALNSEEQGAVDSLSDHQVAWLKEELEWTTATNVFLFMHKPYFDGDWDRQWANVAEVIKGHPVKVVFGSHWHLYRYAGEREGVQYVVSGGGGADMHTPEEEGGFFHYLYVRVRGDQVDWSVVRPGSILPEDAVTRERINEIHALRDGTYTDPVEVTLGDSVERTVQLRLKNPYPVPLASTVTWQVPEGWSVSPVKSAYSAEPGAEVALPLTISASAAQVRFPAPEFSTTIPIARHGGPVTITKRLDLIPVVSAGHAPSPVVVDGDLGEWQSARAIPLRYGWDFDIADTADLKSQVRLMWDEQYLYLAVETEDDEFYQPYGGDIVWSADNVQLFLDRWEWGLSLTPKGAEVFLYKAPEREAEVINQAVQLAVKRDGRRSVYEAAFPASEVAPLQLREGEYFRLSLAMNDLDPSVPERPRHWAELTPGAGSGDANYPRFKVILGARAAG
ncbi:MAG: metallophosphoesterase [Candidatus Hydrogenedentes bacterium]|nr:metallophosphoesterase [Candidatus Hydrogenedentota bacterium]